MKHWKRRICIGLCLTLFVLMGNRWQRTAYADDLTNDKIKQAEADIQKAKDEKKSLQNSLTDVKKLKQELEKSKSNLSDYITELDGQLTEIQTKISELKTMISDKEAEIEAKAVELNEAVEVQEAQYDAMKSRIKFMYEKGDTLYLELFFSSESLGEMLNKADYIEMLSAYDRKMLNEYVAQTEYVTLCKEGLEEEKGVLEEAKKSVEAEESAMNELIADKEKEYNALSGDIANKQAAIAEYEAYIAEQNETIAALEKAVAEERKRLAQEQGRKYDGGIFTWPAPSYTRISDEFGSRNDPLLGIQKQHNGLDMAAPAGSPILAAYDGRVVAAAYSSSMGNYIMIDHGDGLYSIYMHASTLYVSNGTEVKKGDTIAAVGSTGRSTGNHLHFGVRLNGNYVNPRKYLGG